ncbi:MAG: tetratricopeptide repeat protein [Chloroflexi bacterium]|nr:tetratricopeptide repeat protein [Chloroflexota bacterium]
MTDTLRVRLLGGFSIEENGQPVSGLPSRKAEALLAYLVCHQRPFPREQLADLLWDDRSQDQSLANLRSLLSGLRRKLKPYLVVTRQSIGFNHDASYWLDVTGFAETLQAIPFGTQLTESDVTGIETAVSLYQGNFLDGFYVRESHRFEEWVSLTRERYQRLAVKALQQLVDALLTQGQYETGIEYAVRLLEFDPLSEMAHRQLMLLLARSGQRHAALRQYDVCMQLLDSELGVPPATATSVLYERIRASQTMPLHNLPSQTTAFVGRQTEMGELRRVLSAENGRFLTLLGPGGIGKTRLALQTAHQIIDSNPGMFLHGVRFVSLHTVADEQILVTKMAEMLGVSFRGAQSPQMQLINYLHQKEMLIILDDFEQIMGKPQTAVQFLNRLLQQAPLIKLLVTSRIRLHARGERVFDMRGLPFPVKASPVLAESYAAVRLFIQGARRVQQSFEPDHADMRAIVQVCQLLDGIPLGIEMAAAWVRFLSCSEIVAGIEQDLDFLQQSGADAAARHGSLRAAFAHSWRLLDEAAQVALQKLAVFRGSFSRGAAQAVADVSLPLLARLVDQSWVRRTTPDQATRYEMLTTMRQFAAEQWGETAVLPPALRNQHLTFYVQFLQDRLGALQGGRQQQILIEIGGEIEEIRFAIEWAIENVQIAHLGDALDTLFHFYDTRSWFQEGAALFARGVTAVQSHPVTREQSRILARLQARYGWFLFHLGQYETCRELLQQSVQTLRLQDAYADLVFSLNYLGAVTRHIGEFETAIQLLEDAFSLANEVNDLYGASIALNILGQVASLQGDFAAARDWCQQSLVLKREIGDQWGMTYSLTYLGRVAQTLGEHSEAQSLFRESLVISQSLEDQRGMAFSLQNLGETAVSLSDYDGATQLYQESLDISKVIGDRLGVAFTLARLGEVQTLMGAYLVARRMFIDGLQEALAIGSVPAMLVGVLETAVLHRATQNKTEAIKRLHYVYQHPGSSQSQKNKAKAELSGLDELFEKEDDLLPIESFVVEILQLEREMFLL